MAVAAANPLATAAGLEILNAGGSAMDAAVAVQMVLTLVEPQSSGIGGGAFLLHHNGQAIDAWDGRETAPAAASERLFLDSHGQPMPFMQAAVGGRAVGTPGAVHMLQAAHRVHGRLPWARLMEPAIQLATDGFPVSERLYALLKAETALLSDPVAAAYFYRADGTPHPVGYRLRNPELAEVLKLIARQGARALQEGVVAHAMVHAVQRHPTNPGLLSLADLAAYRSERREALCFPYTHEGQTWRICGFPPPSSGAMAIAQVLGMMQHTPAARLPPERQDRSGGTAQACHATPCSPYSTGADRETLQPSAEWLHYYSEASRLAFADRAQYLGDPDFVRPPSTRWTDLLDPAYLAQRARLIGPTRMAHASAGEPKGWKAAAWASMPDQPEYGTSHLSIADRYGNTLAMTTTIEAGFGARVMVSTQPGRPGGFLLNNELTDFSFTPTDATGKPVANRVQPGKRPRSSMSPTLVLDGITGQVVASAGSPGGALIIHYTAKTLWGMLNWKLHPQQALDMPNFGSLGGPILLEKPGFTTTTVRALQQRGHEVREQDMTSGLQALQRQPTGGWRGGADPRREGVVLGD
jgi:gamma-glutamyltranspeptidase / glutathione hydrolase